MRASLRSVLTLIWCIGCGGDDDRAGIDGPECADGEVAIGGTVDGMVVDVRRSVASYAFVNALGDSEGTLDVGLSDGASLSLSWPRLVANGASVEARGVVDESAADGWQLGNCEAEGYPSRMRMDEEGGGGTFLLEGLRSEPFCEGEPLDGTLAGCFRSPP